MLLTLNNIGPFETASIELQGITLIAGEDGAGKTVMLKTLHALGMPIGAGLVSGTPVARLTRQFRELFGRAILNRRQPDAVGLVRLADGRTAASAKIERETVVQTGGMSDLRLRAFYFSSDVLADVDNVRKLLEIPSARRSSTGISGLMPSQVLMEKLGKLADGRLVLMAGDVNVACGSQSTPSFEYRSISGARRLALVLQALISRGILVSGDVLIFDEPENHLHPTSQALLADVLTELCSSLGLKILLATTSPYIVSGLDVFTKAKKLVGRTRWYHAERTRDGAVISDVTPRLSVIYDSMATAFQAIEDAAITNEQ